MNFVVENADFSYFVSLGLLLSAVCSVDTAALFSLSFCRLLCIASALFSNQIVVGELSVERGRASKSIFCATISYAGMDQMQPFN